MKLRFLFECLVIPAFLFGVVDQRAIGAGPQEESALPHGGSGVAAYHGGLVTPPLPKPKFTLTDTSGAPFDFWSETQKYVTLLFLAILFVPMSVRCRWPTSRAACKNCLRRSENKSRWFLSPLIPPGTAPPNCVPGWIISIKVLSV